MDEISIASPAIQPIATTWWYRQPQAVRVLTLAAMSFGVAWLAYRLSDPHSLTAVPFITAAVAALAVAVFALAEERGMRRDFGSIEQYVGYSRVLRTGELPVVIEPGNWRRRLNVTRKKNRQIPVIAVALIVIAFILKDHPTAAVIYAALALALFVDWRLKERRVAHLSMELDERATAESGDLIKAGE
jgi:hypothetical protein